MHSGLRIYKHEPLHKSFQRVVEEQLQYSLQLSSQFSEKPDFATHEIRKSTKRIRAVYRLFRKATGEDVYCHSKALYTDLSRMLATHRVSAVNISTLKWLSSDKRLPVDAEYMHGLTSALERQHQQLTAVLIEEQQVGRRLTEILATEMESVNTKPLFSCDFHQLVPGLRRTYGSGRLGLDEVLLHPATENLHQLRKDAKSLWIQLLLIRPIWPSYLGLVAHQLDILAQRLGLDHDLAELEQHLIRDHAGVDPGHLNRLVEFITGKRQSIQRTVLPLAMRLYVEKPGTVTRKMERFYRLYSGNKHTVPQSEGFRA